MKTRKIVIAVLMTALLISAMLIVGCIDQFDGISAKKAEDNYIIPPGKGVVRLNIRDIDINARTILPDNTSSGLELSAMYFEVQFKKTTKVETSASGDVGDVTTFPANSGTTPFPKANFAKVKTPIVLDAGWKYQYTITAFDPTNKDSETATSGIFNFTSAPTPIAGYTSVDDAINIGASVEEVSAPINLDGKLDGSGSGFFTYNITIVADDYDYGVDKLIEIFKYSDGSSVYNVILDTDDDTDHGTGYGTGVDDGTNIVFTSSGTGVSLPSGMYTVVVKLLRKKLPFNGSDVQKYSIKQYTEALHIYPAMTSKMTALSIPALDKIKLDVNIDDYGATAGVNSSLLEQLIDFGKPATTPGTSPTKTGFTFGGWWKDNGGGGTDTQWNFSSRVTTDLSLYALWNTSSGQFNNITFTYSDSIDALIPSSAIGKLTRGTYDGSESVSIVFTATPVTIGGSSVSWDASNIIWEIDGVNVSSIVVADTTGSDDTYTLTIDNDIDDSSGVHGLIPGLLGNTSFYVSIRAPLGTGASAKIYSKMITIEVED